jgi:hypothetical protein
MSVDFEEIFFDIIEVLGFRNVRDNLGYQLPENHL